MKKTIPFDLFEPNQTIYFDILRLAELEERQGMSINELMQKGDAGVTFCINGLLIGMKHHYHKATPSLFAEKIEKYLDDGGQLQDIAIPIVEAIFASGIFGQEVIDKMEKKAEELER